MSYSDFSSWPREQEQAFVVYEQRATESTKKAFTIGAAAGALFLFLMVGIYAGVEPDKRDMGKDMDMSNLTKKSKKDAPAPAPTPAAAPAEAPKAETPPAEAPKGEAAPAEAPAAPAEETK